MAINAKVMPSQFIFVSFSLKKMIPERTTSVIIERWLIPKTIELSMFEFFRAFSKKKMEPRFTVPSITDQAMIFQSRFRKSDSFRNKLMMSPTISDTKKIMVEKKGSNSSFTNSC